MGQKCGKEVKGPPPGVTEEASPVTEACHASPPAPPARSAKSHGKAHGPWKDDTFTSNDSEIHAPRYFEDYSEFGDALKNSTGELILRDLLTKEIYNKFKDEKTTLGVTFDKCIKGGVDRAQLGADWNVGKVGVLFGDAECVTKYKELMHPIIVARHGNPKLPHPPPNLDGSKLKDHSPMDASYVISTRVRTGRSISGFPLPPSISADQRKELEGIVTKALSTLEGELKGDYYPLAGSTTYAPKPKGIDKATEEQLTKDHFLFQEPDEPMLLSWRMERDWPHARGIYHNDEKTALVWVNEEDHLRIISMQNGNNIRAVFDRFGNLVKAVEAACIAVGRRLEISDEYGNILSCPSNCGTGLRASMMIKIPLASMQPDFKTWCAERKLQARGSGGFASDAKDDGIRDVSNVDRMGKDEVQLVNEMIEGVTELIKKEKQLEARMKKAKDCEWMFGDCAQGAIGFTQMAHLNPLRWSGSQTIDKAIEALRKEKEKADHPIVVKIPSGVTSPEIRIENIDGAIDFLDKFDKYMKQQQA
jgi:creatine kinase